ncbi:MULTISPECIES: hypothetical protein [unclassified Pseudoxanthomonas]|uniref:hypothetical protein n=1 Tax=unclassified Pseudoxanthomonas TaxID=2645906 RepID=UPI003077EF39
MVFRQLRVDPRRLYGTATLGTLALFFLLSFGFQQVRLFAFGATPIAALFIAFRSAASLDRKLTRRWLSLAKQWFVFCTCIATASAVIDALKVASEMFQTTVQVFSYGAMLYALLGLAMWMRPLIEAFWLRVGIVFLLSSLLSYATLTAAANNSLEKETSPMLLAVRPWLGFWPGVVAASDPHIEVSIPASPHQPTAR